MENESRFLLDQELFEDLKAYLEDKRSALRDALLYSIAFEKSGSLPQLSSPRFDQDTFHYALSEFDRRWKDLTPQERALTDHEGLVERLSNILWNYIEILEGMCKELFDQAASIPIDIWDQELYDRLEAAKIFLGDRLKEIEGFLQTFESSLKKFALFCLKARPFNGIKKAQVHLKSRLDPDLTKRVQKAKQFLDKEFNEFIKGYNFFQKAESVIETDQYKFQGYTILNILEINEQRLYRRLWRLLKLWERSYNYKRLNERVVYTLRHVAPPGKVSLFIKDYLKEIKESLFDLARKNRTLRDMGAQARIAIWRGEVNTLIKTLEAYRVFLFATDPVPRKRSFFSFLPKRMKEHRKTKELLFKKEEAEQIDAWLAELFEAQELSGTHENEYALSHFNKAQRILLDMGQPLISRSMMSSKAENFIKALSDVQELTSTLPEVSELMLDRLLKAFKVDAKHETLTETKGFWPLWEVHHGLSYYHKTPAHLKRMKVYKRVVQHLKHWIIEHQLNHHLHDVEHEIHDIQECLQEFYHASKKELSLTQKWELKKELLEERVFFSSFFSFLKHHNHEGKRIRVEFSFLEKYFNAIDENLL